MNQYAGPKRDFNKKVFYLYQSTSDDLMIWCWFNVLILSMTYGLDMVQISLVFSVSFWVALGMKVPARFLVQRLGAGASVRLSAFLFLSAAVLLTFGKTLPAAIIGQSIYLIALIFQEMSVIIVRNAAGRDSVRIDYVRVFAVAGSISSVISLIAAVFMSRLFEINENLPMYICIGFCVSSCILAFQVSRYDTGSTKNAAESLREALPGARIRSFDRTTISCLFLSVLFMATFTVAGDNLKIMIENDLSLLTDKNGTVFFFSMFLLVSRIVKMLSDLLLYRSRKRKGNPLRNFSSIVEGVLLFSVIGFLAGWATGSFAVILAVSAFMIRVLAFDPFRFSIYEFILRRLNNQKMVDVLFVQSVGVDLFTALFSTVSTIILRSSGMQNVMFMLLIIGIVFTVGFFVVRRNLIRRNGSRRFYKWKREEVGSSDQLMVASAALLMHYGVIQDKSFTPKKLAEKVSSVEDIQTADRHIRFKGFYDYNEEILKELFYTGHPCAVRAMADEGEPEHWLPVVYLDDDGGVVWNPYSEERFLVRFYRICEICCFTIE